MTDAPAKDGGRYDPAELETVLKTLAIASIVAISAAQHREPEYVMVEEEKAADKELLQGSHDRSIIESVKCSLASHVRVEALATAGHGLHGVNDGAEAHEGTEEPKEPTMPSTPRQTPFLLERAKTTGLTRFIPP